MNVSDERVRVLSRRVETSRDDLDRFVSELDRRRHEAMDLKLQARRHPAAAVALAVGAAGLVAGATYAGVRAVRNARARRVRSVAARVASAVSALSDERHAPRAKQPAPPAAIVMRVIGAVVPVVAGIVARRAVGFLADRVNGRPWHRV